MIEIKNYIGGKLIEPVAGSYLDNHEPALGRVYSRVPASTGEDVNLAIDAANGAFREWSSIPIPERSKAIHGLADILEKNLEKLAEAETRDTGKPLHLSKTVDIPRAVSNLRFFASAIVNFSSQAHVMEDMAVNYTRRAPLGTVGCISPWNLPLYLFTWKIAPALAMGNCVIGKPSELTPMTAFLLSELAIEAGFPSGVLNILHGTGPEVGQAIVDHPKVKAISFTGGTNTGRIIGESCARQFKKTSLELGGKNPNIVFADCDFEETISSSVRSAFTNQGEVCLCGSRILVERKIYDRFREAYVQKVKELKIGNPFDDVQMGAVISEDHMNKVLGFIDQAIKDGGTLLTGGHRLDNHEGYFVEPTVIDGLDETCSINQDEVFGPVVTLMPFEEEKEAIKLANSTRYGLSATIWTNNLKRAHRVSHQLEAGIIWINCWLLRDLRTPFGGMKQSGIGREGGEEALRFFSEAQNICVKL